jgi:hypothetical protein
MAKVLKSFPYAANGFTVEQMKEGDDRDFGKSTQGLVDEGFIEGVKAVAAKPAAVTPATKK